MLPFKSKDYLLFRPSTDWMGPTHRREGNLLYEIASDILHSPKNIVTETTRITSTHISRYCDPAKWIHKISHHK